MRLGLIVGHSEEKQGAVAGHPLKISEYRLWKELSLEMWRYAKETGLDCQVFLRDGTTISGVTDAVNEYIDGEGASIELHFNAFGDPTVRGVETLYVDEEDKYFASIVHKAQIRALTEFKGDDIKKPKDRGLKLLDVRDRGFINLTNMMHPAVLVEPFFGSNQKDCELFARNKAQYCKMLVRSFIDYNLVKGEK